VEKKEISIRRLELVRDIFVFSCHTGFAYVDVANLTSDHVKIGVDENKWLVKPRQKTGTFELVQYSILQCGYYRNTRITLRAKDGRCYSQFLPNEKS